MLFTDRLKNLLRGILQRFGSNINLKEAILIVLLVLGITIIILFSSLFPSCDPTVTLEEALDDLEFSRLEIFPVDLELYFSNENSDASRNDILNGYQALLMPLTIHLGTNHPEGNWKWYLYARNREYEVLAPGRAVIKSSELDVSSSGVVEVEGNPVYEDGFITLWFDEEKRMNFGHINLLKSLADRVLALPREGGFIMVNQGEKIGYTMIDSALDITMLDTDELNGIAPDGSDNEVRYNVCPLGYFSRDMRTQINRDYYNYVYTKMKEGGKWPESDLCNPIDIHIDGTIWGNWWYSSGHVPNFDEPGFYERGEDYHHFSFPYGLVVFLNKDNTNPATYWRNPRSPYYLVDVECPGWEGLYMDYEGITLARDLQARYVELISGSFSFNGILMLKSFNNVTDESQTKYVQFSLDLNDAGQFDDELSLMFYNTLTEAQEDDFSNPTVYVRDMDEGTPFEELPRD